jgi:hypothetical protein
MKAPLILVTGALAVLAIAVSSCANSESHSAGGTNSAAAPVAHSPAVPVSLAQYFNSQGIYPDGAQFSGGIDHDNYACSSNLLAAQTWNGVPFQPGTAIAGSNVIACQGQTIPLAQSGHFSRLEMLAIAVNGAQADQNFTVTSDDNSSQTFTQSLSDWAQPDSNPNESTAITMEYRDQGDGTKDESTYYIYSYSFALDSTKTPQSLKLPDNNNVIVFALTLVP